MLKATSRARARLVAVLAAFVTSMVLVIFSGYRTPEQAAAAAAAGCWRRPSAVRSDPVGDRRHDLGRAAHQPPAASQVFVDVEVFGYGVV